MKWNNNGGEVRRSRTGNSGNIGNKAYANQTGNSNRNLGIGSLAVFEESDEENEDSDEDRHKLRVELDDIPQAFSHFSYEYTNGRQLVCDIQGVWNGDDGFLLTDPVIHQKSAGEENGQPKKYINGATDKGLIGMKKFFETHVCSSLCKKMGLPQRTPDDIV